MHININAVYCIPLHIPLNWRIGPERAPCGRSAASASTRRNDPGITIMILATEQRLAKRTWTFLDHTNWPRNRTNLLLILLRKWCSTGRGFWLIIWPKKDGVAIPLFWFWIPPKLAPENDPMLNQKLGGREAINLWKGQGGFSTQKDLSAKWGMVSYWIYHINHPMVDCLFGSVDWNLNNHPRHPGWAASTTKRGGLETPWTSEETSEHVESWIPNLWVEISWWNVMFQCQYYKMESMRMLNIK